MTPIKISVVNYTNSLPYIEGLKSLPHHFQFTADIPSLCAQKMISGQASIGLLPVASLPSLKNPFHFCDYGIAAHHQVDSVLLLSHQPLEQIQVIELDYHSRTSAALIQLLAQRHWKIKPTFTHATPGFETAPNQHAKLIIGDRAFQYQHLFPYHYDLATAWYHYSGLPFVFAAWISTSPLSPDISALLTTAFDHGIALIPQIIEQYKGALPRSIAAKYLTHTIIYRLSSLHQQGMQRFLNELQTIQPLPQINTNSLFTF